MGKRRGCAGQRAGFRSSKANPISPGTSGCAGNSPSGEIQLYKAEGIGKRLATMEMRFKLLLVVVVVLALAVSGCTSITNLGSDHHVRNASGLYPVAIGWDSNQRSLRPDSLQPVVLTDFQATSYRELPMTPVPGAVNCWTALVPVPKGVNFLNYRVKMNFQYDRFPKPGKDSRLSPPFQFQIIDP